MKLKLARAILAATVALQLSCGQTESPTAPEATEPFPVTIQTREAAKGEAVPTVHAVAGAGSITIRVTRRALCATIVDATVRRGTGQVDIVAHVWPNPAALCAAVLSNTVVDYTGTLSALPSGPYLIRVFDGNTNGSPPFIGSVTINVPAP